MKQNLLSLITAFALLFFTQAAFSQGSTTSGMNGRIVGTNSESLPGATVVAIDVPTGSQYGTVTDLDGYFRLPNMNVGGPYKVTVTFVGYEPFVKENIYLQLGQTLKLDVNLSEQAQALEGIEIVAQKNDIFDGNRTGAETFVSNADIQKMPTIDRSIADFARVTPQAKVSSNGAISMAGMNNRYNAISIDGAVNNDVFGLAAQGTNGGQTGATPISLDAIDQFQIVLAPYDVRQGGFTGASINAVTRRGTNEFEGSAYYLFRNQGLAGKTPGLIETDDPQKLADFTAKTYGFRLGGPIIKNKLFFFINAEFQRDETPKPFSFSEYTGDSDEAALQAFADKLRNDYGYDAGGYLDKTQLLESDKFLARLDWNINKTHKLMFRHSYVKSISTSPYSSTKTAINFANNGVYFPSKTNSTALELKSNWNNFSNSLIVGYTTVRDDRDPIGDNFPNLMIFDGAGTIYAGSEPYSTGNQLDQDIFTFTDNFSLYKGAHTLTFGVNVEMSHSYNLFMRKAYGEYRYLSLNDFMNNATTPAYQYERGYSLLDDVVGDGSKAAADFNTMQAGFYIQDDWQVNDKLKVTAGIRFDIPVYLTEPDAGKYQSAWDDFNTNTITAIEAAGLDTYGAQAGKMPKSSLMFNPRLGFNYDVKGDQTTQLRGGLGLFTSRLPLVWPGGAYTNNGVTIGGVYHRSSWGIPIEFRSQWDNQYTATDFGAEDAVPSGQMDLFAEDFKLPQILRASVAVDQKLPWGLVGTVEAMYSKTLNNVLYYNLNQPVATSNLTGGPDTRPMYPGGTIDSKYTRIILGTNTNEGYSYNFTAQLLKQFDKGFTGSLAYTFGRSMSLNDGTSSQNSSQWRYMENVNGLNKLDLSYSDFDMGSRLMAFVSYRAEYANYFASTFGFYYNGQSGQRFSYVYNDNGNLNGEGENPGNLIWIPNDANEINLVDIVDGEGNVTTAADQWNKLNSFIESDKYLNDNRGGYAERNGARLPFESIIDFKFIQDFYMNVNGKKHTLQFTFDIFNFTNLLNSEWGARRYITNDAFQLIKFAGFEEDGTTPTFNYTGSSDVEDIFNISDSGINSSRWQGQIGLRYIFN
ncbi:MAG: TonB-dependent receptor [Bacteroidales bacterium]|nr:TonB-dependent receptor [Bacteroidales bacterium]